MSNQAQTNFLTLADFVGKTETEIKQHLIDSYEATREEVNRFDILVAYECEDSYEGSSHFLLRERATGNVFEVHGGHCSCYGYEGQFKPEATTKKYLLSEHAGFFSKTAVNQWLKEYWMATV